jgi:hypothetical protein
MKFISIPLLALAVLTASAGAKTPASEEECCNLNLWTGEGVSLGHLIFPEFNYQATAGSATTDPESLAVGHHDPDRHGITQQAIELALGVRLGRNVRLFGNYSVKIDQDDHWFDEFEEYYAVFSGLPGGASVRGGRFYPRFGMHNTEHHHSIFFVGEYLANGRLIGEDHLTLYGGEIALPVLRSLPAGWSDRLTVSFGTIPVDRPEEEEEEVETFDAEGAHFQDWAAVADYTLSFDATRTTRYSAGISAAVGHNQADRMTQLYALHAEYLWRPEGASSEACCGAHAGEFFRWRTELMLRDYGSQDDRGGRRDFTQFGANTALSYGIPGGKFQTHLRGEYVSGTAATGEAERWRLSPVLAWRPSADVPFHFKIQYNYDHSPSFGDEHSIWAQFSLTWGDCCAHEH